METAPSKVESANYSTQKRSDNMSWNPVLDLLMEIKADYNAKFDDKSIQFKDWLSKLDDEKYNSVFSTLITNQHNEFLLVRYDLRDAPQEMWTDKNSIFRECRSVVLDLDKECVALASMRKFFNVGEVEENTLDNIIKEIERAKKVHFYNKLDGSMQMARWYNGRVLMSGSMALDHKNSFRLEEGYSMLTEDHIEMLKIYTDYTFTFEYISNKDPHVVNYSSKDYGLHMLSARNNDNGQSLTHHDLKVISLMFNVRMVEEEDLDIYEVLELSKELKSDKKEGWVMSIDKRRVKLKCDDFVKMHNILDKLASDKVVIQGISDGNIDDIISKIPDGHKERVMKIVLKVKEYNRLKSKEIQEQYLKAPKDDRKTFMIYVNKEVQKEDRANVRNLYFGKRADTLSNGNGKYIKMSAINEYLGVES